MNKEKIFIGVAWPYANGQLHLGHISGTYLACDFFARYKRLNEYEVLMVSGSDSHGTPITVTAQKEGITPNEVVDKYHPQLIDALNKLGVTFDLYTHTRTKNHKKVVQEEFLKLLNNGYLYEDEIEQLYCTKCERFLPDRYVEGECPNCHFSEARGDQCDECGKLLDPIDLINPKCKECGTKPEIRKTTHFFLDLQKLEPKLKDWISKQDHWRNQVKIFTENWLKEGLKPRAFTRDLKDGIPVPWEQIPEKYNKDKFKDKVIYVWFEAVTGYLSAAIEWEEINKNPGLINGQKGTDGQDVIVQKSGIYKKWKDFWKDKSCKHYYFIGKDNIPFHSIIWPALLLAREDDLNLPNDIPASQFLTLEGKQLSKSRNWYISANHLLEEYGVDSTRFFFAASYPEGKDIDFKWNQFVSRINNELVANLGNFIYRVLSFTYKNFDCHVPNGTTDKKVEGKINQAFYDVSNYLDNNKFSQSINSILELSRFGNQYLNDNEPWKLLKEGTNSKREQAGEILYNCIQIINALKVLFYPFMPHAAEKLHKQLNLDDYVRNGKWEYSPIQQSHKLNNPQILFDKIPEEKLEEEISLLGNQNIKKYNNIVVGEITKINSHPKKDHLVITEVNAGGKSLQIVCGAQNLNVGDKVPVALEGAIVPKNGLEIKKTKFAGVESEGMLCSGYELNINENDEDIHILDNNNKIGSELELTSN